jgi:hypothetical protein
MYKYTIVAVCDRNSAWAIFSYCTPLKFQGLCDDMMNVVNKGNFFETVKALLSNPIDYDVECLREAIMVGLLSWYSK